MAHLIVGSFDSYREAGDAVKILRETGYSERISLIGRDVADYETIERFNDSEELLDTEAFGEPYVGAATGAIGPYLDSFYKATLSDVGDIILSGSVGDMFSASELFRDNQNGGVKKIFKDIGFDDTTASRLSDMLLDGRVIVFVTTDKSKDDQVTKIYNQFGSLDTETTENPLADNY